MKRRSDFSLMILCSAIVVAGLGACSPTPDKSSSNLRPQLLYAPAQSTSSCTCTGTGPGGTPVTVDCEQSACGSDLFSYSCSASGWTYTGQSCGGTGGTGGSTGGGCQCTGTGSGNVPVTVDCEQSACGSDYTTYSCSASGWSWTGAACTTCQCAGTGPGGTPVTADCGQSACGSDYMTYACSASGWSWTGVSCSAGTGGASGTGGSSGSCSCTGTGPGNAPLTASCGQSACGSDYTTYSCGASGWSWTGLSCASGTGGSGTGGSGTGGSGTGGSGGGSGMSAGCGKAPTDITSSQYNNGTAILITAGGLQRRYVLNVPTNYDNTKPYKLVIALHALNGNDKQMYAEQYYGLLPLANNSTIFVAPNGEKAGVGCTGDGSGDSGCGWPNTDGKDLALMDAVVQQLEANFCIDTSQVFATGWSYGASMAYEVGCERPLGGSGAWGVRGIAIESGTQMSGSCTPTVPIGFYASHGTSDSVLIYSGGVTLAQSFAAANGCTWATPTAVSSGAHVCTNESGCSSGHPVEFCSFNGNHTAYPDSGSSSTSWGPPEVWNFLSQFGSGTGGSGTGGITGTGGSGTGGTGGSGTGGGGGSGMSAGCGNPPTDIPSDKYNNGTTIPITVGGLQRRYVLNIPTNYDNTKPYKLVIALHALNGNDKQMYAEQYYGLLPLANNTTIFVAPNGEMNGAGCTGTGSGDSGCGWPNPDGKDLALMDAVVQQLGENFCIDTSQVFATGWSYGASMAYKVGCERPLGGSGAWGVRGIAIESGAQMSGSCTPTVPIGFYASHGTSDSVLIYSGGVTLAQNFAAANGCTWATPTAVSSGAHVCTNESGCTTGHPVEFCSFNGNHTAYPDTGSSSASWGPPEVWNFLSQFGSGTGGSGTGGITGTGGSGTGGSGTGGSGTGGSGTGGSGTGGSGTGGSGTGGSGGGSGMSAGCGHPPTDVTSSQYNNGTTIPITVGALQRRYVLNIPTNYDNTHPYKLVLALHELSGNDIEMYSSHYYGLLPLANNTAIFAAPNGEKSGAGCTGNGSGDSGCGWPNPNGVDIALMDAVVQQLEANFCIDTNRIFATGWSYGASMAYEVGCERPLAGSGAWGVRGIAIYSGGRLSGSCTPTTPIGFYASHGTNDSVLTYGGGVTLAQSFAAANGCTWSTPTVVTSGAHVCTNESGCSSGHPVEFCSFNGNHTPYPDTGSSSASWGPPEVWNFLSQF